MSYCDVCFCLSKKCFFYYFSPFTSSFANPPWHITSPTLSITRSISPVLCKQLVSRKLAHFVCVLENGLAASLLHAYHSQGPRPISVRTCGQTLKRKHANVWWKWTDIPSREVMEEKGWGKRAKRLCKIGAIPFAEYNGHLSTQPESHILPPRALIHSKWLKKLNRYKTRHWTSKEMNVTALLTQHKSQISELILTV